MKCPAVSNHQSMQLAQRRAARAAHLAKKQALVNTTFLRTVAGWGPTSNPANFFSHTEAGLDQGSIAQLPANRSQWDDLRLDIFEGNGKQQWLDADLSWCHLCQEPVSDRGVHVGDRDHINIGYFVYLSTLWPRTWSAKQVLQACCGAPRLPRVAGMLHEHAVGCTTSTFHLHSMSDAQRRRELEGLLWYLSDSSRPHPVLTHSLRGNWPPQLWSSGERVFKASVTRLMSEMLPPYSANVQNCLGQKIWGRSNMEVLYEALHVAEILRANGAREPADNKEARGFFMRTILMEAHFAVDNDKRRGGGVGKVLVEEFLRRFAFESFFLVATTYMNRAQQVVALLDHPDKMKLHQLNSL